MASGDKAKSRKQHREGHVEKIRQSAVLNRLLGHVMGEVEMSATQVAAAKTLLNKYLPDVKQVEIETSVDGRTLDEFSASELLALRRRLSSAEDTGREGVTSKVH